MNGLAPQDRRIARESIVSSFFENVAMKQVQELDNLLTDNGIASLMHKGKTYANSRFAKNDVFPAMAKEVDGELRVKFEEFLSVYDGLEMEMASMSALLTRMFRKCNSLADMQNVLPQCVLPFFSFVDMELYTRDDYNVMYLTQDNVVDIHEDNETAIAKVKARLMMDEVFT